MLMTAPQSGQAAKSIPVRCWNNARQSPAIAVKSCGVSCDASGDWRLRSRAARAWASLVLTFPAASRPKWRILRSRGAGRAGESGA